MLLEERIEAFAKLGDKLKTLEDDELKRWSVNAESKNGWFTESNVRFSLEGVLEFLNKDNLLNWTSKYQFEEKKSLKVGLVLAGNIPLVGFHDVLSVLISGNIALIKPSSEDDFLIKEVLKLLLEIEPLFKDSIQFVNRLNDADAFIATGSDNSARYFEYYFSKKPNIIRKNRTSVGVVKGEESKEELISLGEDIFRYYGLGCRNISKLYLPSDYKVDPIFEALEGWRFLADQNKFANNYHYNRSIYLIEKEKFFENGFFIMKESEQLVAPVGVLYFEYYKDEVDLKNKLSENKDKLQCIASVNGNMENSIPFGTLQKPSLTDYADNIDTLEFLSKL